MLSSYQAGYLAGRFFTRVVKVYLAGKIINSTAGKLGKVSKSCKIDSKDPAAVTENIFNCLEYLD